MEFRTKLDYSSNRQIKQSPTTFTNLSGGTVFGVPFSGLTSGPNPSLSGISSSEYLLVSTFSGNSLITVYNWYTPEMEAGKSGLLVLTPSNSGITQNTGNRFTASTTTTVDGNIVALAYTGVSFDITPISLIELGGGAYSGTVQTDQLDYLTAGTLDFTGRTIWVDVCGITRTDKLEVLNDATFFNIGSSASAGALHYNSGGTLTVNTSDKRFKTNITNITNALSKVLALNGVYYNWKENPNGDKRIGFIAQDVELVVPELVFKNERTEEKYLGVHYDNVTPLLVEAIKELVISGLTQNSKTYIETQTIIAEDNNIELNYNGTHETASGGGLIVNKGISNEINAEFKLDETGDWVTNNNLKPNGLIIPEYTPQSSSDTNISIGNITHDSNFLYIRSNNVWKRISLENF